MVIVTKTMNSVLNSQWKYQIQQDISKFNEWLFWITDQVYYHRVCSRLSPNWHSHKEGKIIIYIKKINYILFIYQFSTKK